ncbi:flippase-like domain-containing protein [Chloroflexia bacterium SDU3-3]|nr:flippase-like domain-containing protein [Chloroflexia bacterium SDU3-3]
MLSQLRGKIILAALIGLVVVAALGLFSDIRQVGDSFRHFNWAMLPAILGFTVLNYLLRWLKWDYYLRKMNMGHGVSYADSGLLFTSGMVMAVTPGKVGEVLKSFLLRTINGTPVAQSAPIVLAERLTDGLAMLLLMGLGLTLYPPARPAFVLLLVLSVAGIIVLQFRPLCERLLALLARMPVVGKLAPKIATIYESTHQLLSWQLLLVSTIISVVSWFGECVAMYYVLRGLGIDPSWLLLLVATFVFAASTLFGLVSFLPGGLGVSEASSTGMLVLLIPGLAAGGATTATLIIRFCTLWFGVSLGAVALAMLSRRYRFDEAPPADDPSVTADASL